MSDLMPTKGQLGAWRRDYAPEMRERIAAAAIFITTVVRKGFGCNGLIYLFTAAFPL